MLKSIKGLFINKSRLDVLYNRQRGQKAINYSVGDDLYGSLQASNLSTGLESGLLLQKSRKNPAARMLVIADSSSNGWGSVKEENVPTNYVLRELSKWFKSLDSNIFRVPELVEHRLELFVKELHGQMRRDVTTPLTSLACAVVCENDTVFLSVGDANVYVKLGGILRDGVRNDTLLSIHKEAGENFSKDERFHKYSLECLSYLGVNEEINPNTRVVPNNYDGIMLTSKSIFRNLSRDEIENIVEKNPSEDLAKELVDSSKNSVSVLERKTSPDYQTEIRAGETDMVVANYKRKLRK